MSKKFDEEKLRSLGFEEGPDGQWRKKGSAHPNPPSGPYPQPPKRKPKRAPRPPSEEGATRRIIAIVTVRTVRPRDYDGLGAASKHYLDGLRHCGLFEDDDPRHLEVLAVAERVGSFQEEETIIELYEEP